MRRLLMGIVFLLPVVAGCDRLKSDHDERALDSPIQFPAGSIHWQDAPPGMPPGSQIAVLEGDPKSAGLFTLRIRVPAGSRLAPHWHPRDERVTVLSGRVGVGFGEVFDEAGLQHFVGGSYYVNPAGSRHYLSMPAETLVQITGMGPWETHFVDGATQD